MALCCGHHGALACTLLGETFQHKQGVGQQTAKTVFKLFNVYSYIIFGLGGGGVEKNYQEIKRGAELIPLLRTVGGGGGHDIIISPLKLISQPPY